MNAEIEHAAEDRSLRRRRAHPAHERLVIIAIKPAEVSPTEAAVLLAMSRPQVRKLMDRCLLKFRKVGTHPGDGRPRPQPLGRSGRHRR